MSNRGVRIYANSIYAEDIETEQRSYLKNLTTAFGKFVAHQGEHMAQGGKLKINSFWS